MDMRYTYDGIELAYSIEGQGDTVVLLHGWGCDRNIWRPTVEFLGNSYRIIAVDFAGFGQSQEPNKVWGVEEYTRSIEALMQELGVESTSSLVTRLVVVCRCSTLRAIVAQVWYLPMLREFALSAPLATTVRSIPTNL